MDVEIPPWLQWVSYLAGGEWPQGSENGMFRMEQHLQAAAEQLNDLIPDLNAVRNETLSRLMGETAQAADGQFAMLFDGDYAVDKLSDALNALGESAGFTGSEIQYAKWSILVGLALAAFEISLSYAMAPETAGASLARIPWVEWLTLYNTRRLIRMVAEHLANKVRDMLARTTVRHLVLEGMQEAGEELLFAAAQEGAVAGIQGDHYHLNTDRLTMNVIASTVGGGAGGATAVPTANFLGPAATRGGAAAKGMTTFFTAGIAGNVAGTLSVGGELDPFMMVVSSTTSSIGGLKGTGAGHGGHTSNGQSPDTGLPPDGESPPPGPDDSDFAGAQPDDEASPADSSSGNDQDSNSVNGARVSEPTGQHEPGAAATTNTAAAQHQPAATATTQTADHDANGEATQTTTPPSTHAGDRDGTSPQTPEDATLGHAQTNGELSGHDSNEDLSVAHTPTDPSEAGQPVDGGPTDPVQVPGPDTDPDSGPESVVAQPSTDHSATTPAAADVSAPTDAPPAADPNSHGQAAPAASTTHAAPTTVSNAHTPTTSSTTPSSPVTAASTPTPARPTPEEVTNTPKRAGRQDVSETSKATASTSEVTATPAARVADTPAATAHPSVDIPAAGIAADHQAQSNTDIPKPPAADRPQGADENCVYQNADELSRRYARYGREFRVTAAVTPEGVPAGALFEAAHSDADFATYDEIQKRLLDLGDGSSAIIASSWAGHRHGGHTYLAVNDGGQIYLIDQGTRSPWPPHWGEHRVSQTAVGYLDATGNAVQSLDDSPIKLKAADAIGYVKGHPDDGGNSPADDSEAGRRWQHVASQEDLAIAALDQRGLTPENAHELRNPLGVTDHARELARYRARDNALWWDSLTGEQQRALIDTYPQHIGNAEGIPAEARDAANRQTLDQDRGELQARHDRGERLTRLQRDQLARYNRIQAALDTAAAQAKHAGVGKPLLIMFDPFAFGGDGRAAVSFGADPAKATSVSWHVPGRGMDIDQIGPSMGDALKQLQSTMRENPRLQATSIAWIGYDTASGRKGFRAAGRSFARAAGAILYSDIRAFNAARDARATDGSHFSGNHIFGHSYGSTTTSYAAEGGRLRNQVSTVTLIGSPGAGPLRHADDAGIGADNFFVASSSRDPYTALGGRTPGSNGRLFGLGLGTDPSMESFGAQRLAAEFSAEMDTRRTNLTHNAYYRYVDRTADPPVRTESLANFGRIAAGTPVDTDPGRIVDDRPWHQLGWRTSEPAEGRPLRLTDDATGEYAGDRDTRRRWNPHWRALSTEVEPQNFTPEQAGHDPGDDDGSHADDSDPGQRWKHVASQEDLARAALDQRGLAPQQAGDLRNPLGMMEAASERARDNALWWDGLTGDQQRALIDTHPQHIGNAEGIPAEARNAANTRSLEQDRRELQDRRDRGERLTRLQSKQLARLDRIHAALQRAGQQAAQAGLGKPLLLAFDPYAFGGNGRALVSFGHDPYSAESVSWHVPGVAMTIDELGPNMGFALNHLQSTLHENPNIKAASVVWLGYDTPRGWRHAISDRSAREGAAILYSDIRAFNTARDTRAADGSHFSTNHIFAHSYGSTTTSYAGRDGRLANDIRTVSLIGSPGAGPLNRAAEFGSNVDVYVASSSRDPIAALGGRTPGSAGRIFGRGMGIDPAMEAFGAQRITAEFSAAMDRRQNLGTHNAYYSYVDRTADPAVRSESLANFGRIAADRADRLDFEPHRTIRERPLHRPHLRTVEPAAGRPLRLEGDTAQSADRQTRRLWNPRWLSADPDGTPHPTGDDQPPYTPSTTELVQAALQSRGVSSPAELLNPLGNRDEAVTRARANARWWAGLADPSRVGLSDAQLALIATYPYEIGNAEGIPPLARHEANFARYQDDLARRDDLLAMRDNGLPLSRKDLAFIKRMNLIEDGLVSAQKAAGRAGVEGPYLLAYDRDVFNGSGRAIVSFGADPYTAKSVSWYVPGMTTKIERLRAMALRAVHQLESTRREGEMSSASIAYIGYHAPKAFDPRVAFPTMARAGGETLYGDISAFNAGRDAFADDGTHFSGNHIFAHSYGSTSITYAGEGGRLARQVATITLIGSPGAGPLQRASEFGIGDNVFVAASSRDEVTSFGGDRPGARGRVNARLGLGLDPAMEVFGARRVAAEFSARVDHLNRGSRGTHSTYWSYADHRTGVRSESLTNFGRIAAGRTDLLIDEGSRTLAEGVRRARLPAQRTYEPAVGRPLQLDDHPTTTYHPAGPRHAWNPSWTTGGPNTDTHHPTNHPDPQTSSEVPASTRQQAEAALRLRGVSSVDELLNPLGKAELAVGRARANARWWAGLADPSRVGLSDAQLALIATYPYEIGNAEGIPPLARHEANFARYQDDLARRDDLLAMRDNGLPLSRKDLAFIKRMNLIEDGLVSAQKAAGRAGVEGPYLLAYDRDVFNGSGRAIVSFGADPYTAKSVSWYVPGMTTKIERLRAMALRAVHQLESTRREGEMSSASIAYIGYHAPKAFDPRVAFPTMARAGGETLYGDISAFNAGRDAFADDGTHFSGNHIFAHSYGSTSITYAGEGGRLARQVATITLIGSPGAGPLQRASEFGIGDNVFVAASSRDEVTSFGGDRPGARGRVNARLGLGLDPAMEVFGARRVAAEFSARVDHLNRGSRGTHSTYWSYADHRTGVRSESLTNFGRIAAGRTDLLIDEGSRTLAEGVRRARLPAQRTYEPAVGRPLQLDDHPTTTYHPAGPRHAWNPSWTTGGPNTDTHHPTNPPDPDGPGDGHATDPDGDLNAAPDPLTHALRLRVPPVTPDGIVNPLGEAELAETRAQANAEWWAQLSDEDDADVLNALLDAHPYQIGNAEGIPAEVRDAANHRVLQAYRDQAQDLQARRDRGQRLTAGQRKLVERINRFDAALSEATVAAERAGLGRPLLLAFDPPAFGNKGRLLLSFGEDPYRAQNVAWHVAKQPFDQLASSIQPALDRLQTTRQGTQSAAAIVWLGDETSKLRLPFSGSGKTGPDGVLYSDIAAFRAAREAIGEGNSLVENRVHTTRSASTTSDSSVVAHRGASHEFPEQTRAAYEEALRQGADGLECDVRLTKDGHIVCIHDKRVDRTSNGTGVVSEMTLAEMQALDYGGGLLTLEQLIELAQGHDQPVTLFVELKEHGGKLERELVALLSRHGLTDPTSTGQLRVSVISFYPDALLRVRRLAPNLPTVQLGPPLLGPGARLLANTVGATAIGPSIQTLRTNPELVDLAASQGMSTYCWTVNNQRDVQYARDLGVDWIATDHPRRTSTWLHGDPGTPVTAGDPTESQAAEEAPPPDPESKPPTPAAVEAVSEAEAREIRIAEALRQRIPPVRPDELRNPVGLLETNLSGLPEEARARARNNAAWWTNLSPQQRTDLIEAYPQHIGNAEGIPPKDRNTANQIVLDQLRDRRDQVLNKIHRFKLPSLEEFKLLRRVNRLDAELRKASADAQRANVDGPLLLAFDPAEFGGDGRAVLSFGADPYEADSVSWHVPGVGTTMHSRFFFGFYASCALNHLQSTLQENPNLKASSIAWIGYDTPSGRKLSMMRDQRLAQAGGELLYSDIRAFNAGRDTSTGGDIPFTGNHVFGYSYGSTTTGHAGAGGRLADHVSTVTLLGSPGAGPVRQASEFGVGDRNVFVASSSRDLVTALGGRTPQSNSRILSPVARIFGWGLGIDPAMESFGAIRITAEVPVALNRPMILGTHDTYYLHANSASDPQVRSEALANFGRIAAGNTEALHLERHRTDSDGRGLVRTVEPAGDRSVQRLGNPAWLPADGRRDPDFSRRQEEYRAQDPATRRVDSRYAQSAGDVVDSADDMQRARQLAEDLSGLYGPYRIQLEPERFGTEIRLTGTILDGESEIGSTQAILDRDSDGKLVAYHTGVFIDEEYEHLRGHGFTRVLTSELERYYVRSGVDRIEVWTHDQGGNIWARRGFTWNPDPEKLQVSLNSIKASAATLSAKVSPQARVVLDEMVQRLAVDHPRLPEPIDIANLATPTEPDLGRRLLEGVGLRQDHGVHYVRYLPVEAEVLTSQPRNGFRAVLHRWFGSGSDTDRDCGRGVVARVAARYGRDIAIAIPRMRTGLPAWAVFEAVGSSSRFASNYDEVAATLLELGPGSSAVLASRWVGGRRGGHAYLAVNDGGRIYLEEAHDAQTSERSDWPPHWGQHAVSQTAVGYLDSDGNPVRPLHDVPLQLGAADAIGDVKGLPEDPDFLGQQADYRAQDPTTREVNTRYADPLGVVLDNAFRDPAMADQLAEDLSGVYGPCRVEMTQEHFDAGDPLEQLEAITQEIPLFQASIYGDIVYEDQTVGTIHWRINLDKLGVLVVEHRLFIDTDFPVKEFTDAVAAQLEPYLQRSGVMRIETTTYGNAAYAAAVRGESWNPDPMLLEQSLNEVKRSARELLDQVTDGEAKDKLTLIMWRSDPTQPDIPQPVELAYLSTRAEPDLGRRLLEGTGVRNPELDEILSDTELHTVRDLRDTPAENPRPAKTVSGDPEFLRRQADYRAKDSATRRVDTRYALPLDEVFDDTSSAVASRLAEDLSGVYGQYSVTFEGLSFSGQRVVVGGPIRRGEHEIGHIAWIFARDDAGKHHAHYELHLHDDIFEGTVFSKAALIAEVLPYAMRSGIDQITSTTQGNSAYAVADLGDTWDPHPDRLQESLDNIERSARALWPDLSDDGQRVVEQILQRLDPAHPRLPEPIELAALETRAEPDLGRRLLEGTRIAHDGTGLHYVKYLWNSRLHSGQNCGSWSLAQLSARYGIPFALATEPSARGVHARALFEAIGSRADFMSYSEVEELLSQMDPGPPGGPGPAALLTSSWAGGPSRGGHAYLAFYDGGRVYLQDAFTGERLGWPPYWGEGAVSRTAVGFLNSRGEAVQRLDSSPDSLTAADEIGHVQGPQDPDFSQRQAEYRAQDPTSRDVKTIYAESLDDVLGDSVDLDKVRRLAADLSGTYGPFRVQLTTVDDDGTITIENVTLHGDQIIQAIERDIARDSNGNLVAFFLTGGILNADETVGALHRTFYRDSHGNLVVYEDGLVLAEDFRGQGFSKALVSELGSFYIRSGVDRVELQAGLENGGYAWARRGFAWDPDPVRLQRSLNNVKKSARALSKRVGPEARAVLDEIIPTLTPDHRDLPEPIDLANLTAPGAPHLGRDLMMGTEWHAVMYLRDEPAGGE